MIMQTGTNVIGDMDKGMTVQRWMDDKRKVWESIRGSWEARSCTCAGVVKERHIHNPHHGNLDTEIFTMVLAHSNGYDNNYLILSKNTNDITKGLA